MAGFRIAKDGFRHFDRDFELSCSRGSEGLSDSAILWTAPSSTTVTFETSDSQLPTEIAVIDVNSLRELGCSSCGRCGVTVEVEQRQLYAIVVTGAGGNVGLGQLNVRRGTSTCITERSNCERQCLLTRQNFVFALDTFSCPTCKCSGTKY